jgi:hypothetical protein
LQQYFQWVFDFILQLIFYFILARLKDISIRIQCHLGRFFRYTLRRVSAAAALIVGQRNIRRRLSLLSCRNARECIY